MGGKQTWEKGKKKPGNEEASVAHLTSDFLSGFKKKKFLFMYDLGHS